MEVDCSEPLNPKLKDEQPFEEACQQLERYFQRGPRKDRGRRRPENGTASATPKSENGPAYATPKSENGTGSATPKSENGTRHENGNASGSSSALQSHENSLDSARPDEDADAEDDVRKKRAASFATNRKMTESVKEIHAAEEEEAVRAAIASASAPTPTPSIEDNSKKRKGRPKKVDYAIIQERNEKIANAIPGLDALHEATCKYIEDSRKDDSVPHGCVRERLSEFAPRTVLDHEELAQSMLTDGKGGHIPFQLQKLLDNIKHGYLNFLETMKDDHFKVRVESDIAVERRTKFDLVKREQQLQGQIDALVKDSLGLLKNRLHELGIQAKNSPEFIERAKGIVCNHHDLQRRKTSLEQEIKMLETEEENLIRVKEQELTDKLRRDKNGVMFSPAQIREIVKRDVDAILKSRPVVKPKVAVLNKFSDVTLTKCGEQISTHIRKRPKEAAVKQRDWPEKRRRISATEWRDSPVSPPYSGVRIIEEKNPEALARQIIEQGRSMERKTSAATLTISPSKNPAPPHLNYSGPAEIRKIEAASPSYLPRRPSLSSPYQHHPPVSSTVHISQAPSSSLVALPKVDLSPSMIASSQAYSLVLPPHPESRSRSNSDQTEELTFGKSKMSVTPRAEQFEDGLKTIIHSVLTNDADPADLPPHHPHYLPPSNRSSIRHPMPHSNPSGYDLVKREHIPPPPPQRSNHAPQPPARNIPYPRSHIEQQGYPIRPPSPNYPYGRSLPPPHPVYGGHPSTSQYHRPNFRREDPPPMGMRPHHPPISSHSTMNSLISSEIERSIRSGSPPSTHHQMVNPRMYDRYDPRLPGPHHRMLPPHPHSLPPRQRMPEMSRMTQIIEDSVRGHPSLLPPGARGPPLQMSNPHVPPPVAHHSNRPELEGLACPRRKSPPPPPQDMMYQRRPAMHPSEMPARPAPRNDYPAMEGLAARFGPYMDKANRDEPVPSSSHRSYPYEGPPRPQGPRVSPSPRLPSPPALPPKKQYLEEGVDYRMPKDLSSPRPRPPSSSPYPSISQSSPSPYSHMSQPSSSQPKSSPSPYPQMSMPSSSQPKSSPSPYPQMSMPSFEPRPQMFDRDSPASHPDDRRNMPHDLKRNWQDAISTGFDRLVAYAAEVDNRHKTDSPTSRPSSTSSQKYKSDPTDLTVDNRASTLSLKFKGPSRYQSSPPPPPPYRVTTPSSRPGSSSSGASPLLPENVHPKKRYFATESGPVMLKRGVSYQIPSTSVSPPAPLSAPPTFGYKSGGLPNAVASYLDDYDRPPGGP